MISDKDKQQMQMQSLHSKSEIGNTMENPTETNLETIDHGDDIIATDAGIEQDLDLSLDNDESALLDNLDLSAEALEDLSSDTDSSSDSFEDTSDDSNESTLEDLEDLDGIEDLEDLEDLDGIEDADLEGLGDLEELEDESEDVSEDELAFPTVDELVDNAATNILRPSSRLLVTFNLGTPAYDRAVVSKLRSVDFDGYLEEPLNFANPFRARPKGKEATGFLVEPITNLMSAVDRLEGNSVYVFGEEMHIAKALDSMYTPVLESIMAPVFDLPTLSVTTDEEENTELDVNELLTVNTWTSSSVIDGEVFTTQTAHISVCSLALEASTDYSRHIKQLKTMLLKRAEEFGFEQLELVVGINFSTSSLIEPMTRAMLTEQIELGSTLISRDAMFSALETGDNLGLLPDGASYPQFTSLMFPHGGDVTLFETILSPASDELDEDDEDVTEDASDAE